MGQGSNGTGGAAELARELARMRTAADADAAQIGTLRGRARELERQVASARPGASLAEIAAVAGGDARLVSIERGFSVTCPGLFRPIKSYSCMPWCCRRPQVVPAGPLFMDFLPAGPLLLLPLVWVHAICGMYSKPFGASILPC